MKVQAWAAAATSHGLASSDWFFIWDTWSNFYCLSRCCITEENHLVIIDKSSVTTRHCETLLDQNQGDTFSIISVQHQNNTDVFFFYTNKSQTP